MRCECLLKIMSKFEEFYDVCQQLYLEGKTQAAIQQETGVSQTTLLKWKTDGEWEKKRTEYIKQNETFKEKLNRLKKTLVDEVQRQLDAGNINTQALHALANLAKPGTITKPDVEDKSESKPITKEEAMQQIKETYGLLV